jgi:hypothetical protein
LRTLFIAAAVLMLWCPAAPVFAQETGESCAPIADDTERLACYDEIYRVADDGLGADEVHIQSEQLIPARPVGRAAADMVIGCSDTGLAVRFSFANQLLSNTGDNAPLSFQVDSGGNTVRNLPVDANNTSVGFAAARDAIAFLNTLEGARNLKVRVTPVRQRSLTVDFRVGDHAEEIGTVLGMCGQ